MVRDVGRKRLSGATHHDANLPHPGCDPKSARTHTRSLPPGGQSLRQDQLGGAVAVDIGGLGRREVI